MPDRIASICLAHRLKLEVVAEGIENDKTLQRLEELGCDHAQGMYICKPMLLPALLEWLEKLQNWGVKQAIASSAPMGNIDALLDGLGIRKYFEAIVSGAELLPKPNHFITMMPVKRHGCFPCLQYQGIHR